MGNQGYPSDWDRRRKSVYRRDDYTCQNCGAGGAPDTSIELHAHHVVPKSKGGTHQLNNLQTLCRECHEAIHSESMSPTAGVQQKTRITTEHPNDDRVLVAGAATHLIQSIEAIDDDLQLAVDQLSLLQRYHRLGMPVENPETIDDLPERYRKSTQTVRSSLDAAEEKIHSTRTVDTSGLESTSPSEVESYLDAAMNVVESTREYCNTLDAELWDSSARAQATAEVRRTASAEMFAEYLTEANEVSDDLRADATITVNQIVERAVEYHDSKMLETEQPGPHFIESVEDCPVCSSQGSIGVLSEENNLIQCTTCLTVFARFSTSAESVIVDSPHDVEGCIIAHDFWEVAVRELDDPTEIKRVDYLTDEYSFDTTTPAILFGIGLVLLAGLGWVLNGIAGAALGALVCFVLAGAYLKHLNDRLNEGKSKI